MKKLKKILIIAAVAIVFVCLLCLSLSAQSYSGTCGAEGDGSNLTWTLDSDGLLKIEGTGAMAAYTSSRDVPWDSYRSNIKTVEISEGVTSISSSMVFWNCNNLTSVIISESVTSIGSGAFEGCSSLESIVVKEGNTVYHSSGNCLIDTEAKVLIAGCKNSIIPDDGSVTSIGVDAFSGCSSLTNITIPASVISIGDWAFNGCSSLESIIIPASVTIIGNYAFYYCSSLTSITIPEGVTSIGSSAFGGCSSLTSITIYSKIVNIGDNEDTISSTAVIYGGAGSTAEAYAEKYGREFVLMALYTIGEADLSENGNKVTIDKAEELPDAKESVLTLDTEIADKLSDKESIDIKTPVADITFDNTAAGKIVDALRNGDVTFAISDITDEADAETRKTIKISLSDSEGNNIIPASSSESNGYVLISVAFKTGLTKEDIKVFYKGENGLEEMEIISYDSNTGIVTFKTNHFSEYEFWDMTVTLGDISGDGNIDTMDLTLLRKYLAGYTITGSLNAADLNGDGKVDTIDLTLLRKYLAGYDIGL